MMMSCVASWRQLLRVSKEYPVVISQFMTETNEIEFDGVAQNGEIVEYGISEHVEVCRCSLW